MSDPVAGMSGLHADEPTAPHHDIDDGHRWADLDPLVKFSVVLGAVLFLGVVIEGILLVPWTLILHGWTPGVH